MKLIIKAKYNVTATQRRHIAEMLENGIVKGGTKAMHYEFKDNGIVECYKREISMSGKAIWRKEVMTYEYA